MSTATYLSSTVRQRSQRARVQRLAVAQRLIGPERSVSGLTVRAIWRLESQAIETLALTTRPELIKGKDFHKMKQVAEAKSTAETVESDGRGNQELITNNCSMPKEKERNDYLRLKIVTYVIMLHVTVSYPSSRQAFRCLTDLLQFSSSTSHNHLIRKSACQLKKPRLKL